jgi:xylulokinase
MPPKTSPHFLGLQLSVDALRAVIVDEQLEVISSEHVDFDTEFPDHQ